MKGVSGRYREKVEDAGREFVYKAHVELKNGEVLELDGHDILLNGLRLSCETSGTGALEVGSVSAAGLELYLNNYTGRFKGIQIGGAIIRPSVGLVVEKHWERGDTPEWVDLGVFIADDKPILEESETQWKLTGNVLAVSNDYGKTWRGIDKDGNALLESLAAKTIVADKVKTGRLEGYDGRSYWDFDTGKLRLAGEFFQYADDGSPATALTNNALEIYSWNDNGNFVGEIGSAVGTISHRQVLTIHADRGDILSLGVRNSSDTSTADRYISITDVPDEYSPCPINFHRDVSVNGDIDMCDRRIKNCRSLIPFGHVTSFNLQKGGSNGVYLEIGNIDQYFGVDVWQSDARLKKSIKPSKVNALEELKKIPHRSFKMKENDAEIKCGYIAQELQELNPAYALGVDQHDEDGNVTDTVYQIREQAIIPLLTKALQEADARIERLEKQVEALIQGKEPIETMRQNQVQAVPEKINKLAKMKIKHPKTVKKEPKPIRADKFNQ